MTVTSVSTVAVSFRTLAPLANVSAAPRPLTSATDSVELSQQAAAEARITDPSSSRAEALLKSLDTDRDGVVSRTEYSAGPNEQLAIRRYTIAGRTDLPKV